MAGDPPFRDDIGDPTDFLSAIADAYGACVRANLDMRAAAAAIESVREARSRNPEAFPTWRELDDQIGRAVADGLAVVLVSLRDRYWAALPPACARWLRDGDHATWLVLLGHALVEWRLALCEALVPLAPARGRTAEDDAEIQALSARIDAMKRGDWDEAAPALEWLGRQTVLGAERARIVARVAQIDLYFGGDAAAAGRRVDLAESFAGTDRAKAEVASVRGQCFIESQERAAAIERLEASIAADGRFVEAFAYLGDLALKSDDLASAESWYRRAIAAHPGSTTGYLRLIRLLTRAEYFASRRSEIGPLADKLPLLVPLEGAANFAEIADAMREAGDLQGALHFADRSVALGPDQGRTYYARGLIHAGLADWPAALADFRQALACEPVRYGKLRWYVLGVAEAVPLLRTELDKAPNDPIVRDALLWFVEESHSNEARLAPALDVVDDLMRHTPAEDAQARAQLWNARGDLHFWLKDYAAARPAFQAAWELDRGSTLSADNLVATLRWLKEFDEAEKIVRATAELTADDAWRDRALGLVANDRGNERFGEGRFDEARALYSEAGSLDPGQTTYLNNLVGSIDQSIAGEATAEALARAVAAFEAAQEQWPGEARIANRLEASRHLQRGVARYGSSVLQTELVALRIYAAQGLTPWISPDGENLLEPLEKTIAGMRAWFQADYGVLLPAIRVMEDAAAPDGRYELQIAGVSVHRQTLRTDRRLLSGDAVLAQAREAGIHGEPATNPLNGEPAMWIVDADRPQVEALGFPLWSVMDYPLYELSYHVLRRLKVLVGHGEARELLGRHGPPSASAFVDNTALLTRLVRVLRGLLAERVPIKAFVDIAELVAASPSGPVAPLVQECRMLPAVRQDLPGAQSGAIRVSLPPDIESAIATHLLLDGPEPVVALPSEQVESILMQVRRLIAEQPQVSALVVRDPALRSHARRIVELAYPQLWVLAEREIAPMPAAAQAATAAGTEVPARDPVVVA